MNWIYGLVAWLVNMGVLRLHRYAYWVTFVGGAGPAATCVWVNHKVARLDDVLELRAIVAGSHFMFPERVTVLSWDRLPGDDRFVRLRHGVRVARRDRGSTPWWAPLLVVALVVWAGYVVTSTLGGGR